MCHETKLAPFALVVMDPLPNVTVKGGNLETHSENIDRKMVALGTQMWLLEPERYLHPARPETLLPLISPGPQSFPPGPAIINAMFSTAGSATITTLVPAIAFTPEVDIGTTQYTDSLTETITLPDGSQLFASVPDITDNSRETASEG